MISQSNFTSNFQETIYNKVKEIVGTTYTLSGVGTLQITFNSAYPADMKADATDLPLIIITRGTKPRPTQFSLGGPRKYSDVFYVDVIAGGYNDDTLNAFMKNSLMDMLLFGFDNRRFNFINYATGAVEGQFQTDAYEVARFPSQMESVFERNHGQVMIGTWLTIKT